MRRAALAATIAILAACAPPGAAVAEVSREQLAELADAAARGEPAAETQLRAVTSVDGVPVEIGRALEGASPDESSARLAELAESARAEPVSPDLDAAEARGRAGEIAGGETSPVATSDEGGGISLPSVPFGVALAVALVALIAAVLISRAVARRRVVEQRAARTGSMPGRRPRDLEREAGEAEARGEYATAIRLRFRAGLERLDAAGVLRLRPALTAGAAARELDSTRLAELAVDYDEIVFGARPAASDDARAARAGWSDVLRGAGA